ncbi:hypothetical protein [Wenxinia saemankumensis]|uniref:Shikimate kinase n=1 Tax=Wenxinia saemankumensis TaxID=1447782 RepID=A0A1M6DS58_9RHOB|nr:hypothetical protein [Wenxinia saemankumensis]SHI76013.1 hypothetical protein SAMN05444417_1571 [Wenxinia saemankumensis]
MAQFYDRMDDAAIWWFSQVHHANLRPLVEAALVPGTVIEGSALRPDLLAQAAARGAETVLLTAPEALLAARIRAGAADLPERWRVRAETFLRRTLRDRREALDAAARHGIVPVDVTDGGAMAALQARLGL